MGCVYLHIGPHKTGSTYIQRKLCENREWLRAHDFVYPELAQDQWGHHKIVTWIKNRDVAQLGGLKDGLQRQYDQVGNVVLSSENFERLTAGEVAELKGLLGDWQVRVVYYARRWPKLLYSMWQEEVKHGATKTLPEFMCSHLVRPLQSALLNYAAPLDSFAQVFGKSAISVVSYDNLLADGLDIFAHFASQVLSLQHGGDVKPDKVNASLPPEKVEILRALNTLHVSNGGSPHLLPRKGFMGQKKQRALVDLDELTRVMEPHRKSIKAGEGGASNALVLRTFLSKYGDRVMNPAPNGSLFKELDDPSLSYVGQDYLLAERAPEMLRTMYKVVMKSGAATEGRLSDD